MNAKTQYKLTSADLALVLALVRAGKLAGAGERLGIDASTVFRAIQRIERGLGQRLFERSRQGYQASELAQALAGHAEQVEAELESARTAAQLRPQEVSGTVRITTTDTILHSLVAPALKDLSQQHPKLSYELHCGNELASLTRRDADIAVRATKRPPPHLVGKEVGTIRVAVYAARQTAWRTLEDVKAGQAPWVAPDDALPEHPSVLWRKQHLPNVAPAYRVNSILTVMELVSLNLGVGILPLFLAQGRQDLVQVSEELPEARTALWVLTHPESRHLRRVSTVFGHLAKAMAL
ncbi:MAG: LysR family transcriptional regulator [Rubrivivax sp.]|nr:MAG: LysR family transcriptional regulator [Rubrivivax sp.]